MACARTLPWDFAITFIPQFFYIGFNIGQPRLVQAVIGAVEQNELTPEVVGQLIRATLILYMGKAVSSCKVTFNVDNADILSHRSLVLHTSTSLIVLLLSCEEFWLPQSTTRLFT